MEAIYNSAKTAAMELCEKAKLTEGDIVVVGCSSSEVGGDKIGSHSSMDIAEQVFKGIYDVLKEKGIYLAAQCCEHLNRAIIIEKACPHTGDRVNVIPQPKAGGSFATWAYKTFENPIAVEEIRADAGLDIGGTLIGMHLKKVAVPLRLSIDHVGKAMLIAARTRAKFVGGVRAVYDDELL